MPAPTTRNDPFKSFNFRVEIDGVAAASFKSVSGLAAEAEVIDVPRGRRHLLLAQAPGTRPLPECKAEAGPHHLVRPVELVADHSRWDPPAPQCPHRPARRLASGDPAVEPTGGLDRENRDLRAGRLEERGRDRDDRARPRGARARHLAGRRWRPAPSGRHVLPPRLPARARTLEAGRPPPRRRAAPPRRARRPRCAKAPRSSSCAPAASRSNPGGSAAHRPGREVAGASEADRPRNPARRASPGARRSAPRHA